MRRRSLMPRAFRRLARSERGFAVPIVIMVMVVGLMLGGAAVTASINAQKGSVRDEASKEALAAAEAGTELALYRMNKIVTSTSFPCVVQGLGGDLVAGGALADGWCEEHSGTVGEGSYRYRVKPITLVGALQNQFQVEIVSIGTANGESRRIQTTALAQTGAGIFAESQIVGLTELLLEGSANVIGNAGTQGSIVLEGSSDLCGETIFGPGGGVVESGGDYCSGYASGEGDVFFPPANQGSVPPCCGNANDNDRFFTLDLRTPRSGNEVQWDPTTRVMTLTGNGTVTLGGTNYSFCRLEMQGNTQLIAARGATPRIFFDSPENCAASGDPAAVDAVNNATTYTQLSATGSSQLVATSGDPKDFAMIFVGSETVPTAVNMTGNSQTEQELYIYGPNTNVTLGGSTEYTGAIVGLDTNVEGNAEFEADIDASEFNVETLLIYEQTKFLECTGSGTQSPPDASC